MSFSFFKPSRPKTPQDVAKAIRDSLIALDTKTVVEVKSLEKALEEVEKNFSTMRCMLSGDGEVEPNAEQVSQLAEEICKEDVISLIIHKLAILGLEARKDLVHCWSILLKQKVGSTRCCVRYIEEHFELLDFLVVCYDNKEIALNCGNMLRECINLPTLAKIQAKTSKSRLSTYSRFLLLTLTIREKSRLFWRKTMKNCFNCLKIFLLAEVLKMSNLRRKRSLS